MHVVIFRARLKSLDKDAESAYQRTAERMRTLALADYACVDFVAMTEGDEEVAISYWDSLEDIAAWRSDPEHQGAQTMGSEHWYQSYRVQVLLLQREYTGPKRSDALSKGVM